MLCQQKLLTVDAFRVQVRFEKYFFLAFFAGFNPGLTYIAVVRTHWWNINFKLMGYLICLVLLFALNCSFWHELHLKIFNFESTKVARCLDGL